ncbi:uncharacterized protein N7458_010972 [Penicillium daleae]|uniref:Uncharacterized protein n=1 Tax=Penicillium daleae TaxID=63821 RepID=A0AAD6C2M7_9EURO|nr:uncharacterized protein N7458_010972 [Penicillium daleae]KAJ5439974.1 hypothetical protein N7458_010972 [Penicillium daleae]
MAPIPDWIHGVLHNQQVIASDASFSEKAIVLLVVGHILVLYTVLCWLGASTITGEPHHEYPSFQMWSFKLRIPCTAADSGDHRTAECLEGQYELELREASSSNVKHGPSTFSLHTCIFNDK